MKLTKFLLLILGISLILLVGCSCTTFIAEEPIIDQETTDTTETPEQTPEEPEPVILACQNSADCEQGELCIDNNCGTVEKLYKTEGCDVKCNFNSIQVTTSDQQTLNLNRGKGDYTSAGAVEWVLSPGPDYCQGEEIIVPVKLLKKNLGKVLSEEYITLSPSETSPTITHPNVKSVQFTFTIDSVNEECN